MDGSWPSPRSKRSVVRQLSGTPRFTAIDFYIPPTLIGVPPPVNIPIRGRAVQLITIRDDNAKTVPAISGTDHEECRCHWIGTAVLNYVLYGPGFGTLNGPGTLATFPAMAAALQITTITNHGPAILTLDTWDEAGLGNPSTNPATMTVPAGIQVNFPGGAPGVYNLPMPGFVAAVAPALAGDNSFDPTAATNPGIAFEAEGDYWSECESTWGQPSTSGFVNSIVGYVQLNRVNPHVLIPGAAGAVVHQTQQCIPIPRAPVVIRVEQEFDWIRIEPNNPVLLGDVIMGVLIIEHETENEVR